MIVMEKVTEWKYKGLDGKTINAAYWYGDGIVKKICCNGDESTYDAAWMKSTLEGVAPDKLYSANRILLDYLKGIES
jgi:hypothetical protein